MFILDSLFLSGFRWVLDTVLTAAETEMNDDTALREQLLAAELRREMGEISDEEFAAIEGDLLARIREVKARREGGSGPIAFGGEPLERSDDSQFTIEATVSGDFHEPPAATSSAAAIDGTFVDETRATATHTTDGRTDAAGRTRRTSGTPRTSRTPRRTRTARTLRTSRKIRES